MIKKLVAFLEKNPKLTGSLAVVWTIIIIVGCSMPGRDLPPIHVFDHFDKVVHFSFFMLFYILWFLATKPIEHKAVWLILIACLFGFAIEFYQINYVAGRSFDVWDGIADTIGALCASLLLKNKISPTN